MIHVLRTASPQALEADGEAELDNLRKYRDKGGERPGFKAYKLKVVREALERMFHGKCAYCESFIGHISPTDVEHWRPKGSIRTEEGILVDGYWWLAAAWTNLFPACPHCNRPTRHEAAGGGTTAGKGMRFPLATVRLRAPQEGEELNEQPLLLNPSDPDEQRAPERHLEFATELALAGVVQATMDESGGDDLLGAKSIDVYALNRVDLVDRRAELLKLIRTAVVTIKKTMLALKDLPPESAAAAALRETIAAQRQLLEDRLAERAEYLLLARQFARPALAELEGSSSTR
jgi:uncharacterized protein (TIGR02646 family)